MRPNVFTEAIITAAKSSLTVAEVAKIVGCDISTVYRTVEKFNLPYHKDYEPWMITDVTRLRRLMNHQLPVSDVMKVPQFQRFTKAAVAAKMTRQPIAPRLPVCPACYKVALQRYLDSGCKEEFVTWQDVKVVCAMGPYTRMQCGNCGKFYKSKSLEARRALKEMKHDQ